MSARRWIQRTPAHDAPETILSTMAGNAACRDQNGVSERTFYRLKRELMKNARIVTVKGEDGTTRFKAL